MVGTGVPVLESEGCCGVCRLERRVSDCSGGVFEGIRVVI